MLAEPQRQVFLAYAAGDLGESPGGSHPPALAEPDVNLSIHPAPIVQPSGRTPKRQCANSPGSRLKTAARNLRALAG